MGGGILMGAITLLGLILYDRFFRVQPKAPPAPSIQLDVDTTKITRSIADQLSKLPDQIVNSITGSTNIHKGKLGELLGYLQIRSEYDRIIPVNSIVDFICIKLPEGDKPGYIHFIDMKSGKAARLSPDQKKLKELITNKQIAFRTIKIDDIEINEGS